MKAVETALAYTNVSADMGRAADPESEKDTFRKLFQILNGISSTIGTDFKALRGRLCQKAMSASAIFLPWIIQKAERMILSGCRVAGPNMPVWFLLRLGEGTIKDVTGGSWKKVEAQVYLIQAEEPEVIIRIK